MKKVSSMTRKICYIFQKPNAWSDLFTKCNAILGSKNCCPLVMLQNYPI
jgi:hypothetical protein